MRIGLFIVMLAAASHSAAQISEDSVQAIIDQGWAAIRGGKDIETGWEITDRLMEIDRNQGNPYAKVNALQIRGESMFWTTDLDSALYWYGEALKQSRSMEDLNEEGHTLVSIATIQSEAGQWQKADSLYLEAMRIRSDMSDTNNILFILNYKSWNLNKAEMHHLAMKDLMQTLEYAEAVEDTFYLSAGHMGLGIAHKKQQNLEQAYESMLKAAEYSRSIGEEFGYHTAMSDLCMVIKSMGRYEEAHDSLQKVSLPFFMEDNYALGIAQVYGNLAVCSNLMGRYERALAETDSSFLYLGDMDRRENLSDLYHERAKAQFGLGRNEAAMVSVEEAIELAENVSLEKLRDAYETKSKILSSQGKFEEALSAYKGYASINDSILNEQKSRQVLELQTVYETSEKERAIERLEAESKLAETKRKGLIGGIAGLILLSSIIINREINRRKKAKKLHETELKLADAEKTRLEDQLAFKKRELTTLALEIARKNEMVEDIKSDLLKADQSEIPEVGAVFRKIDFNSKVDKNWDRFIDAFKENNGDFLREISINFPDLSKSELRLAALIKMNLSSKDIAAILNISDEGVKKARYRLRKKLNLETTDNLESTILSMA